MKKLAIGVQTLRWYDEANPAKSIRFIKECGFEAIDYNIDALFKQTFDIEKLSSPIFDKSEEELIAYYEPLKNALEEHDICVSQMHGIYPMYYLGEDARNEYILEATEKIFAVCKQLGCEAVVIHPWSGVDLYKEEEKQINLNMYRKLIPAAKKYGVKICLENLFKHLDHDCFNAACSNAEESCWYVDTLNAEAGEEIFGFCLDVGHTCVTGANLYQFITTLGKRLTVLHIHDNDGISDSHLIPYTQMDRTGYRLRIEWDKMLRGLREIGYEGTLSFEVFNGIHQMPMHLRPSALRMVCNIGKYFRECIEKGDGVWQ